MYRHVLIAAMLLALALAASACSGSRAVPDPDPQDPSGLPPIAEIADAFALRGTSYLKSDLELSGDKFDASLPHNLAQADSNLGWTRLSPAFSGPGAQFSGLAYCIYSFHLPGYDLNAQVNVSGGGTPGQSWVALANWQAGHWDILPAVQNGRYLLPSLAPYFDAQGNLALAAIEGGVADSEILAVRIGSWAPFASLIADKSSGKAPLTVNFQLDNLHDLDGNVTKIEWDLNADGSYELAGMQTSQQHVYSSSGTHVVKVRLTDNDKVTSVLKAGITVDNGWAHSYGEYGADYFNALVPGPQGSIYAAGQSPGLSDYNAIIARLDGSGQLLWLKNWDGGDADSFSSIACDPAGAAIAAGERRDPLSNQSDALIQKYNADGSLAWSKVWGGSEQDSAVAVAMLDSDPIVAVTVHQLSWETAAYVLRLDGASGQLIWAHYWDTPYQNDAAGLAVRSGPSPLIAVVGSTYSDYGDSSVLGLTIAADGSLLKQRIFGDGAVQEYGRAVCINGDRIYFLADELVGGQYSSVILGTDDQLAEKFMNRITRAEGTHACALGMGPAGSLLASGYGAHYGVLYSLAPDSGALEKALELNTGSNRTSLEGVQTLGEDILLCGTAEWAGKQEWLPIAPDVQLSSMWGGGTPNGVYNLSNLPPGDGAGSLSDGIGRWDDNDPVGEAFIMRRGGL